jgi:hypothetical protein
MEDKADQTEVMDRTRSHLVVEAVAAVRPLILAPVCIRPLSLALLRMVVF